MTILEYLQALERLKNLAVDRFGNLTVLENEIVNSSYEWLIDNLEISRGTPQVDEELSRTMDSFVSAVIQIINDNKRFQGTITSFLSDLSVIKSNLKQFHATTNHFDIEKAGVNPVQKAVVAEIIDQYTSNGLNSHFAAPLRDNIFRNILAGANMKEVKEVLRNYIIGQNDESGKLGRYVTQTAQQAVDSYTGVINQKLLQQFEFTGFIISGSIIETSSTQCIYAINHADNGYLTMEEWKNVLELARINRRAPLIPGTTLDNLPLNKLHWGCRHEFTPIIKAEQKPKAKARKETNEQILKTVEDKIRAQTFESAAAVKDGKLLYFKDGEAKSVLFSDAEVSLMKGAILTHNHPSSRSFSKADVSLFYQAKMSEFRAVGTRSNNYLRRTTETKDLTPQQAQEVYRNAEDETLFDLGKKIDAGTISIEEANWIHHDLVMKKVSKELNLFYERNILK